VTQFVVACASPSTPIAVPPTVTTSLPTSAPTATQTPEATATIAESATPVEINNIPGFEDWAVFNEPAVDIETQDGTLLLTLNRRALWYMDQRGVLAYKDVEGDFKITADVYTMKRTDPSQAPGGDGSVQLGGLMARNGSGGQENYVFIVVGSTANALAVETKNTIDDFSEYDGPDWDTASASLRLCRFGETFHVYKRHIGAEEPWMLADTFERPDLPESLQVGINIYTDSRPDLQVRYENINIEPIASSEECETD
jgi:hypothetical protein